VRKNPRPSTVSRASQASASGGQSISGPVLSAHPRARAARGDPKVPVPACRTRRGHALIGRPPW